MSTFDPLTSIDMALSEISIASASLDRLAHALTELRQSHLENRLPDLPPCDMPVTDHRRQHRMGRVPKIDNDPEWQTFILARLDRLTFKQVADKIARHFPPGLRIHQSTIHRWFQKRR